MFTSSNTDPDRSDLLTSSGPFCSCSFIAWLRHADRSRASAGLPRLRGRQALPAEGNITRAILPEALQPLDGLLHRGLVTRRHPPHHEIGPIHLVEPLVPTAVEALVHGLPDVALERLNALPHRDIQDDPRIVERMDAGCVAAVVLQTPDEPL